nr:hypothetical protein [Tanacetum cinerariifolium]
MSESSRIYRRKEIMTDMKARLKIDISYSQAWRAKCYALKLLRGTPEESFAELSLYCHNLKVKNPRTITHIETDDQDRFEIFFLTVGAAIRTFVSHKRPLIIIDGAHLKGEFFGTMYLAVAMDGNNQILPLAYGGKSLRHLDLGIGLPCGHLIAVMRHLRQSSANQFEFSCFKTSVWRASYKEVIYDVGNPSEWEQPYGLITVLPPLMDKRPPGRLRNRDHFRSKGEQIKQKSYEFPYLVSIVLHHEGRFSGFPIRKYLHGKIHEVDFLNIDDFSRKDMYNIMKKISDATGVVENIESNDYFCYFQKPNCDLNVGVQQLWTEEDYMDLYMYIGLGKTQFLHIYIIKEEINEECEACRASSSAESEGIDQVLSEMQEKLDKLCEQVNYFKNKPDISSYNFEFSCCKCQHGDHHQAIWKHNEGDLRTKDVDDDEIIKFEMVNDVEQEERRMSNLSDWAPSGSS